MYDLFDLNFSGSLDTKTFGNIQFLGETISRKKGK
jgi:hypothetical protein